MKLVNASGFHPGKRILSTRDWIVYNLGKNKHPSTCQGHASLGHGFYIRFLFCFHQSIFCTASDHTKLWPSHLNACCEWIQLLIQMHKCRCLPGNEVRKLLLESVEIQWPPSLGCKDLFIWVNPDVLLKASWILDSGLLAQCWILICLNMGV